MLRKSDARVVVTQHPSAEAVGSVSILYPGRLKSAHVCLGLINWTALPPQVRLMQSIKIRMKWFSEIPKTIPQDASF